MGDQIEDFIVKDQGRVPRVAPVRLEVFPGLFSGFISHQGNGAVVAMKVSGAMSKNHVRPEVSYKLHTAFEVFFVVNYATAKKTSNAV